MKNLILAALLTVTPVTGLQDSLATAAATTVIMEAAQEDLVIAQALTAEAAVQAASIQAPADTPVLSEPFEVEATFYFASRRWGTLTASGNHAQLGTMAAASSVPYGTQYYIPDLSFVKNDGIFTVEDRGGAIKRNKIDIYLPNPNRGDPITAKALRIGRMRLTANRILSPEEAAQKVAVQTKVASFTETSGTQEINHPKESTTLLTGEDLLDNQAEQLEATFFLEHNLAPKQDFNNQLHAQKEAKDF